MTIEKLNWVGIDPERFKKYQHWINTDNTCGMMSAAVLIAYYQDYIDDTIIPESIRKKHSDSYENLYPLLLKEITSFSLKGTMAYDVSLGINRFFRKYSPLSKYKARGSILPTFGIVKTHLDKDEPRPVIVGLNSLLNSPKNYRNHWVLAYRYQQQESKKQYMVHDNHGRYNAIINVNWTITVVRLLKK